jgi:hypothetical protein
MGEKKENCQSGTRFFVHHRIVSAVKRVEFGSGRVSYIVLRGHWCNIIVLNVHAPSEEKSDDSKESFKDNYPVVAKVRERLAVIINKQQRIVMWKD